jgi:putative membrane protein
MGIAEVVPGVSGGTIALITGIYPSLIRAVQKILRSELPLWIRGRWMEGWQQGHARFLAVLGLGMAIGVLALSRVMRWLLEAYALQLSGFFFGLIVAAVWVMGRLARPWRATQGILLLLGIGVGLAVAAIPPALAQDPSLGVVFFGGAVAICAWILPGISGSYLLLLLGLYPVVIEALAGMDVVTLAALGLGCLTGIFLFAGLLSWLLERFYSSVLALLLGVMIGALPPLWPWQGPIADPRTGELVGALFRLESPVSYGILSGEPSGFFSVSLAAMAGLVLVVSMFGLAGTKAGTLR